VSGLARVRRVVAAGRRLADPRDPLGIEARARLPATTGLSPRSVELALSEHLETGPSPADLAALLARTHPAPRCHAILSANVCTAALRAIAIACATAPTVFVKPSRRDPIVAELIARALAEDAEIAEASSAIQIACTLAITPAPGDEVHVYGSDETIATIAGSLPEGVILRAHGTGFGVAVIEAGEDAAQAATGLARDVAAFDQRGCLSPRAVLVHGGVERAAEIARALADQLAAFDRRAPRGQLDAATRAELRAYVTTAQALGACHQGDGFVVGVDEAPAGLVLPPAARAVHVMPASAERAARWLAPWAPKIAAIGAAGGGALLAAVRAAAPRARFSKLGWMQRPPLDGPVDLRACSP
jgi:acyl-CoA reductase-like NAD-dependent aldehyde dehydrogenase